RSIPFKVVYLVGMNDGEYPGTFQRPGFDLIDKKRELCDWSKRNEDKYLFLESILSARKKLFISYTGQSIKDNREIPPSVLVSELLDYLNMAYSVGDGKSIHDHVVIKHPLQPFSKRYFTGEKRIFSYSMENFCAAAKSVSEKKENLPLIRHELMAKGKNFNMDQQFKDISVDDLSFFFANPSRFIVKNILNSDLGVDNYSAAETREPFDLDFLEQYLIKDELLSFFVEQQGDVVRKEQDELSFFHALKASGRLPHGKMGYAEFKKNEIEVKEFAANLGPYIIDRINGNFEVKIIAPGSDANVEPGSGISVKAVFNNLFDSGQVFFRCAKIKPKDILHAWFYHLLFNLMPDYKKERITLLFGIDGSMKFSPMERDAALTELAKMVSLFRQGLNLPLSFFPDTSFAFAEAVIDKNKKDLDALKAAEKKWYSGFYNRGENEDIYIKACFGEDLPETEEFKDNALNVFELILKTWEELDH
ncbi:MAG: hypothetical protein U9N77_00850, partial [Thermodesulfobacteriota bacterium]|nr:hypothetical protein [Thermodesulfobacteriota bacterium]